MNSLPPRRYATTVANLIVANLHEFGVTVPVSVAERFVNAQIEDVAANLKVEKRTAVKKFPEAAEYASTVAVQLLVNLAEERPGTDPWLDQQGNIPVTLLDLLSALASLAIANGVAMENEAYEMATVIQRATIDMTVWLEAKAKTEQDFSGLILAPQTGLAFCVRILRAAGEELMSGNWALPETETVAQADVALRLWSDADALDKAKSQYGTPPTPTEHS